VIKFKLTLPKIEEKWWPKSKAKLTKLVEEYNRENWASQTDPVNGNGWAPRRPPTGGWPILKRSGKMFNSTKFESPSKMIFTAKVGVNYGGFHMSGTSKMPKRRWLGIGQELVPKMEKELASQIFKGKITLKIP